MIGIYGFKNKLNNMWYIGQSIDIDRRYYQHIKNINSKENSFDYVLNNIGIDNFEFKVLKVCNKEELTYYEKYYIIKYNSIDNGYNLTKGGSRFPESYICSDHHREALKNSWTQDRKDRMRIIFSKIKKEYFNTPKGIQQAKEHSEKLKGMKLSDETKQKMSISRTGHKTSDETKKKLSESLKGRKMSDEAKKKMSESHKGNTPANKGTKMTIEQKKLISEMTKKAMQRPEIKEKIYCRTKGKHKVWNDYNDHSKGFHYE